MSDEFKVTRLRSRLAPHPAVLAGAQPSFDQLIRLAKRGGTDPASLTAPEISQICRALVIHYAQMGIG